MSRKVYSIKKVWEQEVLSKIRYPVPFIPVNEVYGMKENGLLEIIAAHRTGRALDEIISKNNDYQEALVQQQAAFDMLDELELTKEQRSVIDQAITANNHFGATYGAAAYRFGMEDGVRLRVEIEKIICPQL